MDPRVRKHAGVEIKPIQQHLPCHIMESSFKKGASFVRWNRLFMGMRPSPYNAVRHYYWGEEFARGNRSLPSNPMGYDQIRLNLPGMGLYDPSLPEIMKWNTSGNAMAGDVVTFVDDCRLIGYSKENCHAVHRQFASRIQYLGMQDAPRKFRPPSQAHAGAWTGTIFKITPTSISKTVSSEKWIKGRGLIQKLRDSTPLRDSHDERTVNRKELERITGFLNHLAMTFEDITPFLKGFYLTLNSWREKRSDDGWKVSDKLWLQLVMDRHDRGLMSDDELDQALEPSDSVQAPGEVKICPRSKFAHDSSRTSTRSHGFLNYLNPRRSVFGPRRSLLWYMDLGTLQVWAWEQRSQMERDSPTG